MGRNDNPGNCSRGQLTSVGYNQQIKNGRFLRNLYQDILPTTIDPQLVYLRSTDVPRTFLSLQALLYGLFPFKNDTQCLSEYVPINTMDIGQDTMTPNPKQCPRLDSLKNIWMNSVPYKKFITDQLEPLENTLNQIFRKQEVVGYNIDDMFDCVQSHACHGFDFPSTFTQDLYDNLIYETVSVYAQLGFFNDSRTQYNFMEIAMSKFISEFTERIVAVSKGNSNEKVAIFSGHDTTLLPVLMALGAWTDGEWPPYASMIRIELLDGGSYGDLIRIYYNNKAVVIPGCGGTTCTIDAFLKVTSRVAAADSQCDRSRIRKRIRNFHLLPELTQDH